MITGRLHKDRWRKKTWFAWRPVRLEDGRWIWLTKVWCRNTPCWDAPWVNQWEYYSEEPEIYKEKPATLFTWY